MKYYIFEAVILAFSSAIPSFIIYKHIPTSLISQGIALSVALILFVFNRFVLSRSKPFPYLLRMLMVFLLSTFLQMLVLSTGGILSPFLILFHLFIIGLGFAFSVRTATIFLIIALLTLVVNTFFDRKILDLLLNDYTSSAIYLLSFTTVIPLYKFLSDRYHFKEAAEKLLSLKLDVTLTQLKEAKDELTLTQQKEEAVLGTLSDIVLVTDTNYKILRFNKTAEVVLKMVPKDLSGRPIFEVLLLKDLSQKQFGINDLPIDDIVKNKMTYLISNLFLYTRGSTFPKKVNLTLKPTANLEGVIDGIAFVVSGFASPNLIKASEEEESLLRNESLLQEIKERVKSQGDLTLWQKVNLLEESEKDIFLVEELRDDGIKPQVNLVDVAELVYKIIEERQVFAKSLGVTLKLTYCRTFREKFSSFDLTGQEIFQHNLSKPYFEAPTDAEWFEILIKKTIDLNLLLCFGQVSPVAEVNLCYNDKEVVITTRTNALPIFKQYSPMLLQRYYGQLRGFSGLKQGSGLEGFIVKNISGLLNLPLTVSYDETAKQVFFLLRLSKTAAH